MQKQIYIFITSIMIFLLFFQTKPAYLQEDNNELIRSYEAFREPKLTKPAVGVPFRDPVFHTKIMRVTDAKAQKSTGFVSYYPKLNPFNADESKILIYQRGGSWFIYSIDGKLLSRPPVKNTQTDPQPRWHPTDPNVLFWFNANKIIRYHIVTKKIAVVQEFQDYQFITNFDEGNFSADGNRVALAGKNWPWRTGLTDFFAFDLRKKQILGPKIPATGREVDWVSISPSGAFMVVHMAAPAGNGQWQGTDVYRVPEMTLMPYSYYPFSDHADIGFDAESNEVYVTDNAEGGYPDRLRHIEKYRLQNGVKTDLLGLKWGMSMLISCRNLGAPGWAIVSTYSSPDKLSKTEIYPFQDEIFSVKMDGSYKVRRIAHHRSQRFSAGDYSYNNYWDQPNAAISHSGKYILFSSNWRELGAPEDVYLIDLSNQKGWIIAENGIDTLPPAPPHNLRIQMQSQ